MKTALTRLVPLVLLGSLCGPAWAGDGIELTFGLGLRLAYDSNPQLTPVNTGHSTTTALDLSFGLTQETAQSTLALGLSGSLAEYGGKHTTTANGFANPNLTFAYTHTAKDADFTLNGALTTANLAEPANVTDFQTGTGTRTISTGVDFGKAGPFGVGATAGLTTVNYQDAPGFADSRTLRLGVTAHTDLSPILHFQVGLDTSRFTQTGAATRNTPGLDTSLTLDRKTGSFVADLSTNHAPEGQRTTFDLTRQLELANGGALSYSLGATRAATRSSYVIGSLNYQQALPAGAITLGLNRAVQANTYTDAETVVSAANLGFTRDITARGALALALNWAQQRDTATDLAIANTSLSATWTQSLTADWALDFGYTRRLRDQDLLGPVTSSRGKSDSLFLTLHRDFSVRY